MSLHTTDSTQRLLDNYMMLTRWPLIAYYYFNHSYDALERSMLSGISNNSPSHTPLAKLENQLPFKDAWRRGYYPYQDLFPYEVLPPKPKHHCHCIGQLMAQLVVDISISRAKKKGMAKRYEKELLIILDSR